MQWKTLLSYAGTGVLIILVLTKIGVMTSTCAFSIGWAY